MLDDLGNPSTKRLARALRVSQSTARRWIAQDGAPYPVLLAVFWLTRWGRESVALDAHNSAAHFASYARTLETELQRATGRRPVLTWPEPANEGYSEPLPLREAGSA